VNPGNPETTKGVVTIKTFHIEVASAVDIFCVVFVSYVGVSTC